MIKTYLNESRKTLILGVPFIVNQLLQISIFTVDNIMAGSDSELTLAAVAQGGSLFLIVQLILIGLAMPLTPMYARLHARQDISKIKELFQQSIWLVLLLSIVGIILMLLFPNILTLVGVKDSIIPPATNYMRAITFSIPFFALYLPIRFLNEGIQNPKVLMYITALSIPFNVIGNYIFLNGLFGLPKMGAMGIGLSSAISLVFVFIAGWVYFFYSRNSKKWQLLDNFQPFNRTIIKNVSKIGLPNAIALLMEAGMFSGVTLLSGKLGVNINAANQIAFSYISIIFMIPLGLSFAMTTRIGMAAGDENFAKARVIGVSGIIMGMMAMCGSVLIIYFVGEPIASLYSDDKQVIEIALGLLALAALFQIPDGIQVCSAGALRGLEETKAPMNYAILGYWIIAMPLAIILAFYFDMKGEGLWIGMLCGLGVTSFLGVFKFLKLTKTI